MRNRWISLTLGGVAAVVAVGAGTAAVAAASTGNGHDVLSQQDVARQLAAVPAPVATANTSLSGAAPAEDGSQAVSSVAGTVVVRCTGDVTTLLRWTPTTGFRADDPVFGPASVVSVRFESDVAEDVKVTVACVNGVASATTAPDGDDHGRNRGPGGPTATPSPTATDDHGDGRGGHDDPPGDDHGGGGHGGGNDDGPNHR
jgi:hypothetical protein